MTNYRSSATFKSLGDHEINEHLEMCHCRERLSRFGILFAVRFPSLQPPRSSRALKFSSLVDVLQCMQNHYSEITTHVHSHLPATALVHFEKYSPMRETSVVPNRVECRLRCWTHDPVQENLVSNNPQLVPHVQPGTIWATALF